MNGISALIRGQRAPLPIHRVRTQREVALCGKQAAGCLALEGLMRVSTATNKLTAVGTSLAVQWLRLHASNAGGVGSIPGRTTATLC